jgi:hypothetical protein
MAGKVASKLSAASFARREAVEVRSTMTPSVRPSVRLSVCCYGRAPLDADIPWDDDMPGPGMEGSCSFGLCLSHDTLSHGSDCALMRQGVMTQVVAGIRRRRSEEEEMADGVPIAKYTHPSAATTRICAQLRCVDPI